MTRLNFFIVVVTCAFILLAVTVVPAFADGIPEVVLQADRSVIRVVVPYGDVFGDGHEYFGFGSAFVISHAGGSTYLVTNQHVVSMTIDDTTTYFDQVYILPEHAQGAILNATVIHLPNSSVDLAFLRVDTGLASRPVLKLMDSNAVNRGDACYAAGFPDAADRLRDDGEQLPSTPADVTFSGGNISQVGSEFLGQKTLQITAYINHGNSGGPLLNSNGHVIGVNTYGNDGVNKSIYINYIMEAADRLDISYTVGGEETAAKSGLLIIVGVVALAAVAAVIIVLNAKGKKKTGAAKRAESIAAATPAGGVPPQAAHRLKGIRGTGGQYNTTEFLVSDRMIIGRDPARCNIVFTPQTEGVSSVHCEIRRAGDSLQLIDHGSTYGTFLAGAKIQASAVMELKAGSSFYLGDKRNSFVVI